MVGQTFLSAIELASGEVLFSRANSSLLGGLKPALPSSMADKNVCPTNQARSPLTQRRGRSRKNARGRCRAPRIGASPDTRRVDRSETVGASRLCPYRV